MIFKLQLKQIGFTISMFEVDLWLFIQVLHKYWEHFALLRTVRGVIAIWTIDRLYFLQHNFTQTQQISSHFDPKRKCFDSLLSKQLYLIEDSRKMSSNKSSEWLECERYVLHYWLVTCYKCYINISMEGEISSPPCEVIGECRVASPHVTLSQYVTVCIKECHRHVSLCHWISH